MKHAFFTLLLIHCFLTSMSQNKDWQLSIRLPLQYERQEGEFTNSLGTTELRGRAFNFGIDVLLKRRLNKVQIYGGLGFYRNQVNIVQSYDAMALNPGRDSLPIGTVTDNYVYSLLRTPVGITLPLAETKSLRVAVGLEYLFNFCFHRKYNGEKLRIVDGNYAYRGFTFFGNALNFNCQISKGRFQLEPFVRLYNQERKDRFLEEDERTFRVNYLDGFGLAIA